MWYAWNPRDDNTSAIYVNNEVELPQFELASVEKTSAINKYNIGSYLYFDITMALYSTDIVSCGLLFSSRGMECNFVLERYSRVEEKNYHAIRPTRT